MAEKLSKGVRFYNGKYRWEISYKKIRVSGSTNTLEEAIQARIQAKTQLAAGLPYIPDTAARMGASITEARIEPSTTEARMKPRYYKVEQPVCGEYTPDSCPTLLESITQMMRTDWKDAKSIRTIRINAEKLVEFFGPNIKLYELTTDAVDKYVLHCQNVLHNANGTINRKVSIVSSLMKKAYKKGQIPAMPFIERFQEAEGRIRFITPEEEAQILNTLKVWGKDREKDAVIILIDTGIRTGELYKLETGSSIDLTKGAHGVIFLHETKNGTSRAVPLTERAKDALLRLIASSPDPNRVLPEQEQWLRHTWDRLKIHLGYTNDPFFVPHILRHTCCSRLVQKGAPLKKVQMWMGHKSILTTMRYAHLSPTDLYDMTHLLE